MPQATITAAQLQMIKTGLVARFNAGLAATQEDWKKIAKLVNSTGFGNTYAWLSQFPAFTEWLKGNSRQIKKMTETAMQVTNRKFETTVTIAREDIEDDQIGQYGTLAEGAGQSAQDLKNDLVFALIANGFTQLCYDGQYFFDVDHPVYPNADGTGTAAVVSNMQAGAGSPWVLLCTNRAPSPFYLQERTKPEFKSITNIEDRQVFTDDQFLFGSRWRGEAVFGFWQCAFGSKANLDATNFMAAYTAMMKFKADGGRRLGLIPNLLVVGPDNMAAAEALIKTQYLANGAANPNYNKVELLVTPFL